MKKFTLSREFWRDTLWFAAALAIFYLVYIISAYWPNIVEGFNRGWSGQ